MKLENLKQSKLNTSLMGVMRGVLDYYDIKISDGRAFGGSGHAFLINIHEVVCPSGPYCWKYDRFYRLLQNLGLQMTHLGFFHKNRKIEERKKAEDIMRQHLDNKRPCSVLNMDNQIIYGYDDKVFFLSQPWDPKCEVTPPRLTSGTWDEFGDEIHTDLFFYQKIHPADDASVIRDSLHYALDLFKNPDQYNFEKYKIGSGAYDNWIKALEQDKAHEHGNWWNATVWSECRNMAGDYFAEIAKNYQGEASKIAEDLSALYKEIADLLKQVSNKEMDAAGKIPILVEVKLKDEEAVQEIEEFLGVFEK